ncbi:SIR2 family protein [Bradyrhizobium sp. S69]|uniref:SIR2 family protein n=1 Tax=Bradyrhizobium sp. S69 TaxID=1641856 RepID=UPI00131C091D|nr:SIR2 family protein [Bradyrhizobium sp. S69]
MPFWDDKTASTALLRLFEPTQGWRAHDDVTDGEGRTTAQGACRSVELALHNALNASNLLVLTGAGSSYCAKTHNGQSAPSMAALWDAVEAAATTETFNEIVSLIPNAATLNKNIEKLLTLCKLYSTLFNDATAAKIAAFVDVAEKAILKRVDFVTASTELGSHRNLIRKIARRSVRKPRAKIFTTNYDLCFEAAAREQQFVVIDGFSHSIPQTYDRAHFSYDIVRRENDTDPPDYIESVFHLYKLHGSIDWRRKQQTILRSTDPSIGSPVLIYPRDSKFQEAFDAPYLDMMGAFQSALREPDTAIIISGFGFNDDHLAMPVMAAIEANMSLRVIVCDVSFLADSALEGVPPPHVAPLTSPMRTVGNQYFEKLKNLVAIGDQRIMLLNGRFEDMAHALPDLVAQTERERHLDRMQRLREVSGEGPPA